MIDYHGKSSERYLGMNSQDSVVFCRSNGDKSLAVSTNCNRLARALSVHQIARDDITIRSS